MIKEAIVKIVSKEDLTYDEAYAVMNEIMSGETTPQLLAESPTQPDIVVQDLGELTSLYKAGPTSSR